MHLRFHHNYNKTIKIETTNSLQIISQMLINRTVTEKAFQFGKGSLFSNSPIMYRTIGEFRTLRSTDTIKSKILKRCRKHKYNRNL